MASVSATSAMRLSALVCRQHPRLPRSAPRVQLLARSSPVPRRAFSTTIAQRKDEPPKTDGEPAKSSDASAKPESEPVKTAPETTQAQQEPVKQASEQPGADASSESVNAAAPETSSEPVTTSSMATKRIDSLGTRMMAEEAMDTLLKERGMGSLDQWIDTVQTRKFPPSAEREFSKEVDEIIEPRQDPKSFFFDETDPDQDSEDFDEFNEDDMTEMAHAKLQEIQEMRQYQRLAVWELPLLSKLAKPFVPPTEKMPLRWRYTTYFGDTHPAEKKVVVQFAPDDLGLTQVQSNKLKKLCGTRYNPELELVKMSCESYETPAQNKRYLAELVDKLIADAKDPKDTFEDIPLDTRHHKTQQRPRFPKEWLMTKERQAKLTKEREQMKMAELKRKDTHQMVDGNVAIENHLVRLATQENARMQAEGIAGQGQRVPVRAGARVGGARKR